MRLWYVDAFTDQPWKGNPAAVCVLPEFPSVEEMQQLANELNISETTYLVPLADGRWHIRWFSPNDEAPLCGHATLAGAHVLWQQGYCQQPTIHFFSQGGNLSAEKSNIDGQAWISMDFPLRPISPIIPSTELQEALDFSCPEVYHDPWVLMVIMPSAEMVTNCKPELSIIEKLPYRAVIITAKGDAPYDFVSRYFAPKVGIPEDPVCGSAHCRLAPYWAKKMEKKEFLAYQSSKRGGVIKCTLKDERVILAGQAVTVIEAQIPLLDEWWQKQDAA